MRKATTLLLLAISCFAAQAQITIDSLDLPVTGDSIERGVTTSFDISFDPTIKALNTTWDCSWLKDDDDVLALSRFDLASNHSLKDSFPNATMVQYEDTIEIFGYTDSNGYYGEGASLFGQVGKFNPQPTFTKTPITYGDDYHSTGYMRARSSLGPLKFDFQFYLDRDIDVINYGKVKMPDNVEYNVLVSALTEIFTDTTTTISGTDTNTNARYDSSLYYEFYAKEFPLPLLRVKMDGANIQSIEFIFLGNPVNIAETKKSQIQVFPNPSNGNFTIKGIDVGFATLSDLSGRQVHKTKITDGQIMELQHLPKGVYMMDLRNENMELVSTEKVVIK